MSNIEFFYADFSKSNFNNCNLSDSHLSECNISGATFDWAKLDNTLLDNVKFNRDTSFLGVDLHKVNFTLATLLYDLVLSQQRIQQLEEHHKWFARFLRGRLETMNVSQRTQGLEVHCDTNLGLSWQTLPFLALSWSFQTAS